VRYEYKCEQCDHNVLVVEMAAPFDPTTLNQKLAAQPRAGFPPQPVEWTPSEWQMLSTGWRNFSDTVDDAGTATCPECRTKA
jgi:hypothetical protein